MELWDSQNHLFLHFQKPTNSNSKTLPDLASTFSLFIKSVCCWSNDGKGMGRCTANVRMEIFLEIGDQVWYQDQFTKGMLMAEADESSAISANNNVLQSHLDCKKCY